MNTLFILKNCFTRPNRFLLGGIVGILLCSLLYTDIAEAQEGSRYYAFAFVVDKSANPKRNGICSDYRLVTSEERVLPAGTTFEDLRIQFRETFRSQHQSNLFENHTSDLIPWGRVLLMVAHDIDYPGWNCTRRQFRTFVADTYDGAQRGLENWKKNCGSRCSGWEEIVFWPGEVRWTTELGQPNWTDFDGVTFTNGKTGTTSTTSTRLTSVKATNNRTDRAAVLVILQDGVLVEDPIVLQPGQSFSGVLREGQELRAHRFITPEEATSEGIIRVLRRAIQEYFDLDADRTSPTPGKKDCANCGSPGVRG